MISRESEEYKIGLMEYAFKEIGFYGMCHLLSYSSSVFRRMSDKARENLMNEDLRVMEGYDEESCNEFIYDIDRITKSKALKMQSELDSIINNLIDEYEETLE